MTPAVDDETTVIIHCDITLQKLITTDNVPIFENVFYKNTPTEPDAFSVEVLTHAQVSDQELSPPLSGSFKVIVPSLDGTQEFETYDIDFGASAGEIETAIFAANPNWRELVDVSVISRWNNYYDRKYIRLDFSNYLGDPASFKIQNSVDTAIADDPVGSLQFSNSDERSFDSSKLVYNSLPYDMIRTVHEKP